MEQTEAGELSSSGRGASLLHHSESHRLCSGSRRISWGPQPKEWPDLTHIEVCLSLDGKIALMTIV